MKKLTIMAFGILAIGLVSCQKEHRSAAPENNIETRASNLGFDDVVAYTDHARQECAAGNHVNCDVAENGTHHVCTDAKHDGQCRDGARHPGQGDGNGHHQGNGQGNGNGHHQGDGSGDGQRDGGGHHHGNQI